MSTIVQSGDGPERKQLPQIPKDRIAEFARYLQTLSYPERRNLAPSGGMGNQYNVGRVSDVAVTAIKIAVKNMKPTQSEFDADKVQSMGQNIESFKDDIFFIANDNEILDGHHRWAALKHDNPNTVVTAIRTDIPIKDLVQAALEFSPEREDVTEVIKLKDLIRVTIR